MKKSMFAAALAALLSVFLMVPVAYAGTINSNEEDLLATISDALNQVEQKGLMSSTKNSTYYGQARSALANDSVDMSKSDVSSAKETVSQVLAAALKYKTPAEAKANYATLAKMINDSTIAKKYNIVISTNASAKNGEFTINGNKVASSNDKVVNQTGFDASQSLVVVGLAAGVLVLAFASTRKSRALA